MESVNHFLENKKRDHPDKEAQNLNIKEFEDQPTEMGKEQESRFWKNLEGVDSNTLIFIMSLISNTATVLLNT